MKNNRVIPRVAAVHDMSGFGKVSLTEAIPIMSAMGVEVCPLPTAVLSTHTYEFENYTLCDLTEEMDKIINHWDKLGLEFDAVYSGYMSSPRQLDITMNLMKAQREKGALLVVDPVMGDNTLLDVQSVYSERMRELTGGMKALSSMADVVTPNVTEACMLLEREYPKGVVSNGEIKELLSGLCELGAKSAVITSVMDGENSMCVAVCDGERYYKIDCGYINRPFHGTGDVYTSVLTGGLVLGKPMLESAVLAADFVAKSIKETIKHPTIKIREGVLFEKVLADGYFAKANPERNIIEI
ncbi:MAG: pyridoxamine kinase [Clostridia bacterium]|nr:pyridoxamine kinase [Clostridia bacterium]